MHVVPECICCLPLGVCGLFSHVFKTDTTHTEARNVGLLVSFFPQTVWDSSEKSVLLYYSILFCSDVMQSSHWSFAKDHKYEHKQTLFSLCWSCMWFLLLVRLSHNLKCFFVSFFLWTKFHKDLSWRYSNAHQCEGEMYLSENIRFLH